MRARRLRFGIDQIGICLRFGLRHGAVAANQFARALNRGQRRAHFVRDELHGVPVASVSFSAWTSSRRTSKCLHAAAAAVANTTAAVAGIHGQTTERANAMAGTSCDATSISRVSTFAIQPVASAYASAAPRRTGRSRRPRCAVARPPEPSAAPWFRKRWRGISHAGMMMPSSKGSSSGPLAVCAVNAREHHLAGEARASTGPVNAAIVTFGIPPIASGA